MKENSASLPFAKRKWRIRNTMQPTTRNNVLNLDVNKRFLLASRICHTISQHIPLEDVTDSRKRWATRPTSTTARVLHESVGTDTVFLERRTTLTGDIPLPHCIVFTAPLLQKYLYRRNSIQTSSLMIAPVPNPSSKHEFFALCT